MNQALRVYRVNQERKKMNSKETFTEGLWNLRKKPTVSIEEVPDKEAIHIAVNKPPMPPALSDSCMAVEFFSVPY